MKKNPEKVTLSGEVIGKEQRNIVKHGTSHHVSIPAKWRKFFSKPLIDLSKPLLELRLVKDDDGGTVILITRAENEK